MINRTWVIFRCEESGPYDTIVNDGFWSQIVTIETRAVIAGYCRPTKNQNKTLNAKIELKAWKSYSATHNMMYSKFSSTLYPKSITMSFALDTSTVFITGQLQKAEKIICDYRDKDDALATQHVHCSRAIISTSNLIQELDSKLRKTKLFYY